MAIPGYRRGTGQYVVTESLMPFYIVLVGAVVPDDVVGSVTGAPV